MRKLGIARWSSAGALAALILSAGMVLSCTAGEQVAPTPTSPAGAAPSPTVQAPTGAQPSPTARPATGAQPTATVLPAPVATPSAARPAVIPPVPKADGAQYGGTLRVGYFREPLNMDGIRREGTFDRIYLHLSNEYLMTMGKRAEYDPKESLAYAFEVLDNSMRIRFYIREGVKFHRDMGEMKAQDVAWSLNLTFDPNSGYSPDKALAFAAVDKYEVVDDYTVDLVMKEFDGLIVGRHLYDQYRFIRSQKYWEQVGPDVHLSLPVGTGPYYVEEWTPGVGIKYQKHPDYWKEGRPYADSVEVQVIVETRTRLAALQTGQLNNAWLQAEMVPEARESRDIKVWDIGGVGWDGWTWVMGLPPTDDLRIRKAMIKAVDRQAINKSIYLDTLQYHKAWMYDPATSPYGIDLSDLWDGEFKYDPAEASRLVVDYAREKRVNLPITVKGVCERRPDRQLFCEYLQAAWEIIGIKFEFPIVATVGDAARIMDECQTNLQQVGSGVNPIAGPSLDGLVRNRSFVICADKHKADQAVNEKLETLLNEAMQTIDPAVQAEKWRQVQRIAMENAWNNFPALLRVNFVGCHIPTTGGCDENPMYAHGFWHTQDMWLKR